jgi:uroporphyrinogen-III decarboxylase
MANERLNNRKMLNNRERLLSIMAKQSPDCIPWIPRLEIWYKAHKRRGTLPEKYQTWSLREIEKDLGIGTPARVGRRNPHGANIPTLVGNKLFRVEFMDLDIRIHKNGYERRTEYSTPLGAVSTLHRSSQELELAGIQGIEVEHMIKSSDDYPVVEYIIRHTAFIPTFDDFHAYEQEIGDDGVPLVYIGQDPMNRILQELIGYNNAYYHLSDYPDLVSRLFDVLIEQSRVLQKLVSESPAKLILHGQHFDSAMTPPPIFKKYMLPYYQSFNEYMHQHDKVIACHADADTKLLLPFIKDAGFDMVECFVTEPMVSVTMEEARAIFGNQVIIWGGIPSTILCEPYSDEDFKNYIVNLFRSIAPGDAFILGVADNVVPEAKLERLQWVTAFVKEYGRYPIQPEQLEKC